MQTSTTMGTKPPLSIHLVDSTQPTLPSLLELPVSEKDHMLASLANDPNFVGYAQRKVDKPYTLDHCDDVAAIQQFAAQASQMQQTQQYNIDRFKRTRLGEALSPASLFAGPIGFYSAFQATQFFADPSYVLPIACLGYTTTLLLTQGLTVAIYNSLEKRYHKPLFSTPESSLYTHFKSWAQGSSQDVVNPMIRASLLAVGGTSIASFSVFQDVSYYDTALRLGIFGLMFSLENLVRVNSLSGDINMAEMEIQALNRAFFSLRSLLNMEDADLLAYHQKDRFCQLKLYLENEIGPALNNDHKARYKQSHKRLTHLIDIHKQK